MAHIDPIVSERKVNELAQSLWEKAGKPKGGQASYKVEAERRLKEASKKANPDLDPKNDLAEKDSGVGGVVPSTSPGKQPINPS